MINILEKDDAVIITVENPSARENELIRQAKALNSNDNTASVFSKFKCNKNKTECKTSGNISSDFGNLDDFEEILSIEDVPF